MSYYNPHRLPKVRSKALTDSANGRPCTLRIASFYPGHRCSGDDTVIGAHLPVWGKGKSTKVTDMAFVYGCFNCHAMLDPDQDWKMAEFVREKYPLAFGLRLVDALTETHAMMVEDGLIVIPGAKILQSY